MQLESRNWLEEIEWIPRQYSPFLFCASLHKCNGLTSKMAKQFFAPGNIIFCIVCSASFHIFFSKLLPIFEIKFGYFWHRLNLCFSFYILWQAAGNYALCALTDPGSLSPRVHGQSLEASMQNDSNLVARLSGGKWVWGNNHGDLDVCDFCGAIRLPHNRAHHCKVKRWCIIQYSEIFNWNIRSAISVS